MPLSFTQARDLILERVKPLETESVPLLDALGRALAEPVIANLDMPRFDNSAMDGFAVRTCDCTPGASLRIVGYIPAGAQAQGPVEPGTACRIMTGAPLPPGADAVVPFEETREEGDLLHLSGEIKAQDHIRFVGEDIRQGDLVIPAGTVLRPAEISLLASFNRPEVRVARRVRVAILSTGDELFEVGQDLPAGGIINSNSWALAAAVREIGGEPIMLGVARDNAQSLREKMIRGLEADVLITSAGVSEGDRDFVREILEELGVEPLFWKVDVKPGRPTAFGMKGSIPVFSLPGNPVSTMITFEEFVRPALLKMMGHARVLRPMLRATLQESTRKKAGRTNFMRVAVDVDERGELVVASSGDQNTGILRTLIRASAIAVLPQERDVFSAGERVQIHLLGPSTGLGG